MSTEEQDIVIGRLMRERKALTEKRLAATERVRQVASAIKRLAEATERNVEAFSVAAKDPILRDYLDLARLEQLVREEADLVAEQQKLDERVREFGF